MLMLIVNKTLLAPLNFINVLQSYFYKDRVLCLRMSMGVSMFSLRKYKQLVKADRGSNAVEFALLALPFFGLILGVVQLGIIFLANQSLDAAVDSAAREIRTGQVRSGEVGLAAFRTSLCDRI